MREPQKDIWQHWLCLKIIQLPSYFRQESDWLWSKKLSSEIWKLGKVQRNQFFKPSQTSAWILGGHSRKIDWCKGTRKVKLLKISLDLSICSVTQLHTWIFCSLYSYSFFFQLTDKMDSALPLLDYLFSSLADIVFTK